MKDTIAEYFLTKYKKAEFSVVPGHWPDFKSTEEVDEWFDFMEKITGGIRHEESSQVD